MQFYGRCYVASEILFNIFPDRIEEIRMYKIKDIFTYYLVRMRSAKEFESSRVCINNLSFSVEENRIWRYLYEFAVPVLALPKRQLRSFFPSDIFQNDGDSFTPVLKNRWSDPVK